MQTLCPLIGLFKPFKARQSLIALKSLTNIRWCRWIKPKWLFPYARWYWCRLFVLLSNLTSLRWNRCSILAIKRGTKIFMFHLSIGRGRRNSKSSTCFLGIGIGCLKMKDLKFFCLPILTSTLSPSPCFLSRMVITSCKFRCLILNVYIMMSLPSTFLWIPFSLIPFMGLLSSSLPWWDSTNMFLTLLLFPTSKLDLKDFVHISFYIFTSQWSWTT